ncbi:MAG: GNAT family N-acetyltransferase [Actinomycetota bacterium]|nr:GNAT family N-acetyltransferase [Actinomycetota bacterium]
MAALRTDRLLLRQWRESDCEQFATMNSDPVVMEHFPGLMDEQDSERWAQEIRAQIAQRGWGLWAVELHAGPPFAGFVGLNVPRFMPDAVEVGWRLITEVWGHGYATEAAGAAVRYGFEELHLQEIISFTTPANLRSRRVMERLGMTHDPADDFDHPFVDPGPIKRHVLYRLTRERWSKPPAPAQ